MVIKRRTRRLFPGIMKRYKHLLILADSIALAFPDKKPHISLMIDASNTAIGAVLHQNIDNTWQHLSFFSKKLSPAQQKCSTYDRELLAIYAAIKHFQYLLEGRQFTIFSDHKPLQFAFKQKHVKNLPRRQRPLEFIAQFSTDIQHISGRDNAVADALSRIETISFNGAIDFEQMSNDQLSNPDLEFLKTRSSLKIISTPILGTTKLINCDISTTVVRPLVPKTWRLKIF